MDSGSYISKEYWDSIVNGHIKDHIVDAFKDHRNVIGSLSEYELQAIAASGSFPTGQEWITIFRGYYQVINNGNWVIGFNNASVPSHMINVAVDRFINQYDADKKKEFAAATASLLNLSLFTWAVFNQIVTHPDLVVWFQRKK